jgi:hypothetical protein
MFRLTIVAWWDNSSTWFWPAASVDCAAAYAACPGNSEGEGVRYADGHPGTVEAVLSHANSARTIRGNINIIAIRCLVMFIGNLSKCVRSGYTAIGSLLVGRKLNCRPSIKYVDR